MQHLPPCTFSILCTCPRFTASRTVPDSPLRRPAHQEVQQSCTNASEDSQNTEHTAGGSALVCTCLPETQRQVFLQLMQARQCRPRACSELVSMHVSLLLSLLGGERAALDESLLLLPFQACCWRPPQWCKTTAGSRGAVNSKQGSLLP